MTEVAQVEMPVFADTPAPSPPGSPPPAPVTVGRVSCPRILDLCRHSKEGRICANPIWSPGAVTFFAFLWAWTIKINEVSFAFMFLVLNWLR